MVIRAHIKSRMHGYKWTTNTPGEIVIHRAVYQTHTFPSAENSDVDTLKMHKSVIKYDYYQIQHCKHNVLPHQEHSSHSHIHCLYDQDGANMKGEVAML